MKVLSVVGNRPQFIKSAPLSVALWFMSMDLAAYLGGHSSWEFDLVRKVSLAFGLGMVVVAYITDQRTREDFAFWLYLFGFTAVWGSISSMHSDRELNKLLYCLLNIGFIALGALLRREGTLSVQRAQALLRQICAGVEAAHDEGILHRDLKPANVFIVQRKKKDG